MISDLRKVTLLAALNSVVNMYISASELQDAKELQDLGYVIIWYPNIGPAWRITQEGINELKKYANKTVVG